MPPIMESHPKNLTITPEPFNPTSFSPFGTAITTPLPRNLSKTPPLSSLKPSPYVPAPVIANQSTALKYNPISPFVDQYTGKCPSGQPSEARMSMFCCFPRDLRKREDGRKVFDVKILERHPFTSQTFIPVDLSREEEPVFLVIVAPTLKGETATATVTDENGKTVKTTVRDPPDLRNLRAFVARGGQAVTYAPGTWHAPMVVLGDRRVDFVVVQFANGVGEEDCQEASFGEGIVIDLGVGRVTAKL